MFTKRKILISVFIVLLPISLIAAEKSEKESATKLEQYQTQTQWPPVSGAIQKFSHRK